MVRRPLGALMPFQEVFEVKSCFQNNTKTFSILLMSYPVEFSRGYMIFCNILNAEAVIRIQRSSIKPDIKEIRKNVK